MNGFTSLVKDIKREYRASLLFLLKTHSSGENAKRRIKKWGSLGLIWWSLGARLAEFGAFGITNPGQLR